MTKPKPELCRLPGGGLWRILDECPALGHNTLQMAERGARNDRLRRKCICPRARALYDAYIISKKAYRAQWYRTNAEKHKAGMAAHRENTVGIRRMNIGVPAPNMDGATCRTATGILAVDTSIENPSRASFEAVRKLCDECPIKLACRAWVLDAELKPGSWGTVYGGLTPGERIAEREKGLVAA